jgi:hypothetical protein
VGRLLGANSMLPLFTLLQQSLPLELPLLQ